MSLDRLVRPVKIHLREVGEDHGILHAMTVLMNTMWAINRDPRRQDLSPEQMDDICAAALLHDVDDHKLFNTVDFENARNILTEVDWPKPRHENITKMIDYVSASKWGNTTKDGNHDIPWWMLIVRDADRVEALGIIGIERCYQYTMKKGKPIALAETPRATTDNDLKKLNLDARFAAYPTKEGGSDSMIDHFYDKLLSVGELSSGNPYLANISKHRSDLLKEWLFQWCQKHPSGVVKDLSEKEQESIRS